MQIISGEELILQVTAVDACGNLSEPCEVNALELEDPNNPGVPLLCPPDPPKCSDPLCGEEVPLWEGIGNRG